MLTLAVNIYNTIIPDALETPRSIACASELLSNESYLILFDQTKINDLHGEVSRELYPNVAKFKEMPLRLTFKFEGWRFTFIPGTNGHVPHCTAAHRTRVARAADVAPPPPDTRRYVDVKCMDGMAEKIQRWYYEEPEAIGTDQRTAER
eukprot:3304876-Pleurochrysis_carterae.AAC.3